VFDVGTSARDEYWSDRRRQLLHPEVGAVAEVPMSAQALVGHGPSVAVEAVLALLVLQMEEEARAVLEFIPRLEAALADAHTFGAWPEHKRQQSMGHLPQALHLAVWLRDGVMTPRLAGQAHERLLALNRWFGGGRFTPPNLTDLMLLCLENGDVAAALALIGPMSASRFLPHRATFAIHRTSGTCSTPALAPAIARPLFLWPGSMLSGSGRRRGNAASGPCLTCLP
jgi:hypothetical protein